MIQHKALLLLCPLAFFIACEAADGSDDGGDDSSLGEGISTGTVITPIITATEGEGSSSDEGESSSSGGGGGVSMCDPYAADCEEGSKCAPYDDAPVEFAWDANGCFPVQADADVPGDECEVIGNAVDGVDSCDATSMCMPADFEDLEAGGTCIAFCEGSAEAPGCAEPTSTCVIANDGVINLCLDMCDPVLQDCGEGAGCYLNPTDGKFFCFAQDEVGVREPSGYGDPCGTINYCDAGLQCAEAAKIPGCDEYCCTEFCDLTDPAADEQCSGYEGGQRCVPHFPEGDEPPGFEHVGLCAIPQ
jgi:hypothetical protein